MKIKGIFMIDWKNIKEMIEYPADGILSKVITKTESNEITLFCMGKNTEISEHTSTKKGFVYVIEGQGIFNLEGKEIKMETGVFIFLKKNIVHSLKAKENTAFILSLYGR
jgi:nitric oxide dioxygenase